jgi:hypothetical protein
MTTTRAAVALRLLLGAAFAVLAVAWLFTTEPTGRILGDVRGHLLTRADLAVVPMLLASASLFLLAAVGRARRPARAATVWFTLAGLVGWIGIWWVASDPLGEGTTVAPLTRSHGLTESDLLALPVLAVAGLCGAAGVVALLRSAARR